jgi:hypothetical protein
MNKDNKWTINYSWTQPYTNWKHPVSTVDKEIAVIDAIDNIVAHMKDYPDAKKVILKINNDR